MKPLFNLPLSSLILLSLCFLLSSSIGTPDSSALLSFKSSSDPLGSRLSSWDPSTDPCSGSWVGVSSCDSDGRVTQLVLESLSLSGTLRPLSLLPNLQLLSLKNNSFSDQLHLLNLSLWRPHLKLLYLSKNRFSGPLPPSLLKFRHLRRLDLAENRFSGGIPSDIGLLLPGLLTLRLDHNRLSGEIPSSIGEIRGLVDLDVSYNHLVGEIPTGISHFPNSSFTGNTGLCGKPFEECPEKGTPDSGGGKKRKRERLTMMIVFLAVGSGVIGAVSLVCCFLVFKKWRNRKREEKEEVMRGESEELVFFEGCKEFDMAEMMRGSAEMLGRGVVGSTYRVLTERGMEMVVKRLRKEMVVKERKQMEGVLKEIGKWRHPNVVSLSAYYYSEELLLVFDYVARGSLHNLLHGKLIKQ